MSKTVYSINVEEGFDGDLDLLMPIENDKVEELAEMFSMDIEELVGKKITIRVSSKKELDEASVRGLMYAGHSEKEAREIVAEDNVDVIE